MSAADLAAEIRRLDAEATPQPWEQELYSMWGPYGKEVAGLFGLKTDGTLAAILRNNATAIADLIEAAEKIGEAWGWDFNPSYTGGFAVKGEVMETLRDALDRLGSSE